MSDYGKCDCGRPWEYTQHSQGDMLTCRHCNVGWNCDDAIKELEEKLATMLEDIRDACGCTSGDDIRNRLEEYME